MMMSHATGTRSMEVLIKEVLLYYYVRVIVPEIGAGERQKKKKT